tara:strand:- start:121 stop:285 length:165 start_codon:yes stop_codon:yes gene_type:complete
MREIEKPTTCEFCGETFYTESEKLNLVSISTEKGEVYACRYICASQLLRKDEEC